MNIYLEIKAILYRVSVIYASLDREIGKNCRNRISLMNFFIITEYE